MAQALKYCLKNAELRCQACWKYLQQSTKVHCPMAMFYYSYQSQKMNTKIKNFTKHISAKTTELNNEKRKTDLLLYQILPVSIVKKLKQNKNVEPEHFQSVTLYFSDILGFTTLAGRCSPIEVVELLNRLYIQCDAILDQYDVYKVETIGDAYMVASGLPKRNKDKHSCEVATMALDILQMMEDFIIPYMNGETLLMRIGMNTGPVAAGIVGSKMPRYCLFGDTVNVASRMESSGQAMRIHLSQNCTSHLLENNPGIFETVERGEVEIKGKGKMITSWLLSKKNFPYSINLARAEAKVKESKYWKSGEEKEKPTTWTKKSDPRMPVDLVDIDDTSIIDHDDTSIIE